MVDAQAVLPKISPRVSEASPRFVQTGKGILPRLGNDSWKLNVLGRRLRIARLCQITTTELL